MGIWEICSLTKFDCLTSSIDGQKKFTSFLVTGSIRMHRLIGFSEAHLAQSLPCSLLKLKVSLSSHSPRSSVGEDVGDADGDAVGVSIGIVVGSTVADISDGADCVLEGDDVV